jgi:ABC-type multidrug transport system fused ATPase/permease subunit
MGIANLSKSGSDEVRPYRLVLHLLSQREKRRLLFILLLMVIGSVFEVLSLGIVVPIIGLLTKPDYLESVPLVKYVFGDISQESFALIAMLIMIIVFVLKTVFLVWKVWVQRGYSNEVTTRISRDLYTKYLRQPYTYFLTQNSSTLIRNSQSSNALMDGVIDPLLLITSEAMVSGGLLLLLIWIEPIGTLLTLCVFGLGAWGFRQITAKRIRRWGEADNFHKGQLIQQLQQGFGGIKDVKMHRREGYFITRYNDHLNGSASVSRRFSVASASPKFGLELLTIVCLALLVSVMVTIGNGLSEVLPALGLFGAASFRILPAVNQIIGSFQMINRSRPILSRLSQDLALGVEQTDNSEREDIEFSKLEILDLKFNYDGNQSETLAGVSVFIRRGEAVGLVGQSGSGKSTLVDVLLGFLTPQAGSVLVNGTSIESSLQWWRSRVGYVPQSIFLNDDTLRRNVAFGLPEDEIDENAVHAALRSAQLEEFVGSLPEGINTMVGERGVRLSGGQRQRIGIARALYNNPEVLVLDEATSSLDTETEHGVMQAVQALQGDKTVVIVAHRLSTVEYCDRLYRLDAGRIVDEGTFDEVMNRSQS